MSAGGAADTADGYFTARETPWFRARLALRVAVPLDRDARVAALRVGWSAALAGPPVTVALVAPDSTLTPGSVSALFCAALPGVVALAWSAARLCGTRQCAARALCQAGAQQRTAWLMAASRLSLFAGGGALAGAAGIAALHDPLVAVLPRRSPLRAMFAGGAQTWLQAVVLAAALAICGALAASSPAWARVEWSRFKPPQAARRRVGRYVADVAGSRAARRLRTRIRVPRGFRRPR
jgi:hypothetical protein